jgi:hypothetical protein
MAKNHYDFEELDHGDDWGEYRKNTKKKRKGHREETSRKRSLKDYNLEEDYYEQEDYYDRRGTNRW